MIVASRTKTDVERINTRGIARKQTREMHAEEESCEIRQKNEVQALQAIFMDDFVPVHMSQEDEQWMAPEFILRLKPQRGLSTHNHEVHTTINMRLKFPINYPQSGPPFVQLENGLGISSKDINDLQCQLEHLCRSRTGEELGFILAHHTQAFLVERNKKPRFSSFYEEMLATQKNKIEKVALEEKTRQFQEDQLQLNAFREEFQKKQQILLGEFRKNKEAGLIHPLLEINFTPSKESPKKECDVNEEVFVAPKCSHPKPKEIPFSNRDAGRVFHCGPCLGVCKTNRSVFMAVESNLQESAVVTHLTVPCHNSESRRKQISLIELEFRLLQKIQHANLVPYLAMKYEVVDNSLDVYVADEFVSGSSLNFYIQRKIGVCMDVLRHITTGILQALNALHSANIVHKNLRHSCVFMDNSGTIRVANYSLESRINEVLSIQDERPTLTMYPSAPGRGGKKADIHRLGVLLWTLFQGSVVLQCDNLNLPSSMPVVLRDFITKCICADERNRLSVDDLLSHQFLKIPLRRWPGHPESDDDDEDPVHYSLHPQQEAPVFNSIGGNFPSRLQNEFESIQFVGSGGFGDVLKVRNKLDGNIYAIKRILLDAKSRQLNKKITREVKLLSRLNHENVVRYYNSWIETVQASSAKRLDASDLTEAADCDESDSKSAESVEGPWFQKPVSSSVSIEFEASDDESTESSEGTCQGDDVCDPAQSPAANLQFMYIQMEYCEKSTLRTAIDLSDLHRDRTRIWRLFREIVEGLAYIHQQGIIHRDLKPVNIFLDSEDRVKIGDFGLATCTLSTKAAICALGEAVDASLCTIGGTPNAADRSSDLGLASSSEKFTGQVGTALYVAPETRAASGSKAPYSSKVDIYSLGIIFFEMCHPSWPTGMERIKVLSSLRQPDISIPHSDYLTTKEVQVISWLLNHNPNLRPSSTELLQSQHLPPPQLEEAELQEMVRHTLSNTQSKAYKHLVAACFKQNMTPTEECVYDMDTMTSAILHQSSWLMQNLQEVFFSHCKRRGAVLFKTPLLAPKLKNRKNSGGQQLVQLMTVGGGVVTLPCNLQTPFARYVARSPNLTWLKRYSLGHIYSERMIVGLHPRESPELAFDIVTPSPASPLSDAEVIATLSDVFGDSRLRLNRPVTLELSHHLLLKALLIHCGIPEDKREDVCKILKFWGQSEGQVQSRIAKLAIPRQSIDTLLSLVAVEGPLNKVAAALTNVTNRKGEAASLAKQAFHEMEVIVTHAEYMGLKCPATVHIELAVHHHSSYSGIVFRFVCQAKLKKNKIAETLATGGRYDSLIASFRNPVVNRSRAIVEGDSVAYPAVVGALIHVDKVISILKEHHDESAALVDVAICTVGHRPLTREQAWLVKELWNNGVKATIVDHFQNVEEVQSWCREENVPNIVLLKDTEAGSARLKTWEKDRYTERKMVVAELIETLTTSSTKGCGESSESLSGCGRPDGTLRSNSFSESSTCVPPSGPASGSPLVNCSIIVEEKLPFNAKRRYETQILKQLQPTLQNFNSKVQVEIVAIEATSAVVQSLLIALYVEPSDTKAVDQALASVVEKHRRQRKYLERIYEQLFRLRFEKHVAVLIIYGLHDNTHRLLM